jgi:hypothetical protein
MSGPSSARPWTGAREPQSGHGLDLVQGIAGPGHWGVTGDATGRQAWARLIWLGGGCIERELSPPTATICLDGDDSRAELERIYAQTDWFFWPYAERIAACDDLAAAADAIVRTVLDDGEASGA